MSSVAEPTQRLGLSRELSEFLVEFSIALHRYSMYPEGHPSLGPATDGVLRRADRLFSSRETLAFGIARRQLIIEGVSTDPNHPVLRRLAEGLHGHRLGAVSIQRGLESEELGDAMRALAVESTLSGPLGLEQGVATTRWAHIKLHPMTFGRLALVEGGGEGVGGGNWGHSELWIGLARAAMASGDQDDSQSDQNDPAAVAYAIDHHVRHEAYDQVVVGYLKQIASELRDGSDTESRELRRRTSELVRNLQPDTLQRLVSMSGRGQQNDFVLDATHGMAVDAVIEIAKAAGEAQGQTISHGLLRILSKLATHAEQSATGTRGLADAALRDQVGQLLADWSLEDPNPQAYGRLLQRLATNASSRGPDAPRADTTRDTDPVRILQMSLELGEAGPLLERAVDRLIDRARLNTALQLAMRPPHRGRPAADAILARCVSDHTIRVLLSREPLDVAELDALLPFMKTEHYVPLLDALSASTSRTTRRRLLDRLAGAKVDVTPLIVQRLEDHRWYVVRNMLVLLEQRRQVPWGLPVARWADHADPRVRLAAIRLQLAMPAERESASYRAICDVDSRIVRIGLSTVQHECPPDWIGTLLQLVADPQLEEEVRALAVGALGATRHSDALPTLLQLVDNGKTWLGRPRIATKSALVVPALRALSRGWASSPQVRPYLSAAARSKNPAINSAVLGRQP